MSGKGKSVIVITSRVATVVVVLGIIGYLWMDRGWLHIQCDFANEQTEVFFSCRDEALKSSPEKAVGYLRYAAHYYPSGTKQISGSQLDIAVERVRNEMIRQIIADLRRKTGKDLGNDPQKWIDEYASD